MYVKYNNIDNIYYGRCIQKECGQKSNRYEV